ncbi:zinc-dependent peptidase [Motiliproteus sediminis]|uniref:zinc-dependent peptidase n=1 Tax=Motiliproteus sediminis TaxID=1468178 RepID=UPI001AEFBCE7|nr:zinc-dependent peptidase [Motiliproteus sediminis]
MISLFGESAAGPDAGLIESVLRADMALFELLPITVQAELVRFVPDFLRGKTFYGCNGLQVTEAQKILVAGLAALAGRTQPVGFFRTTRWILLYPDLADLDGQAFDCSKVVLAWAPLLAESQQVHYCQNLGVHEFTHVMDQLLGISGGSAAQRDGLAALQQQLLVDEATLLDDHAAEGPEEFLAAAAEAFFSAPLELAAEYPDLYPELVQLFGIDMGQILGPWPEADDQGPA